MGDIGDGLRRLTIGVDPTQQVLFEANRIEAGNHLHVLAGLELDVRQVVGHRRNRFLDRSHDCRVNRSGLDQTFQQQNVPGLVE